MQYTCNYCQKEFESGQKNRKFCSRSCQISHRNKQNAGKKRSVNSIEAQKISLAKFWNTENGIAEKKNRSARANIQSNDPKFKEIFLNSIKTAREDSVKLTKQLEKQRNTIKQKVNDGTWNIWKTRNITSYPELYVENYLLKQNILFEREKYVSKESLGFNQKGGYFLDFFFKEKNIDLEIDGAQHLKPERIESDKIRDEILSKNNYKIIRIPWVSLKSQSQKFHFLEQLDNLIKFIKDNE